MSSAKVKKKIEDQGADAYTETPAEFAAFLEETVRTYRQTAQAAGIRAE